MATSENDQTPDVIRRIFTVRNASLLFLAFCVGASLVSVGVTALLATIFSRDLQGRMGPIGQIYESVNAVFSGLGFIALVITFRLQYDELRLQRQELGSQRKAMNKTQKQLRRSAESDIRALHMELMRLSMEDADLAEVWPEFRVGLSAKCRKQYTYANLIVQHHRMLHELHTLDDVEIQKAFHYLFASPIMRGFWEARMIARQVQTMTGSGEWTFNQLIDAAYNDMLLAGSSSTPGESTIGMTDIDRKSDAARQIHNGS